MGNPRLSLTLLLCAGLASAHPGGAQPPDAPAPSFAETIDVEVVEVEIYATDESGRPVTDLGPGDFTVRVDGREVQVTGFYAAGEPATEAATPSPDAPPSAPAPEPAPAPLAPGSGVSFVVYVENGYLDPGERSRAVRAVEEFLVAHLRPGDRAMVVSHDLSLEVVEPFTTDLGRVRAALASFDGASSRGVHNQAEWVSIVREIEQVKFRAKGGIARNDPCPELRDSVRGRVRGLYGEAYMSLEALRSVAESVAGVPGRKMLLFVSAGPPLRPGEDLQGMVEQVCGGHVGGSAEFDLTDELHDIAVEANTAGVTIHALDAGGLRVRNHGTVIAETRGNFTPEVEQLTMANVHDTIYALADQTGGRAILNANDPRRDLELVGEDLTTFYSLAFEDPHGRDGRVHRMAVEVGRPGVRLRYRATYRSQPVAEEMAESTLAALYHGDGEPFAGGRLEPGEPTVGDGGIALPVRVDLPFGGITLLPGETGELEARLRLFVAIRDVHGRVTEVQEVPLPLRVSREKYPDGPPERLVFPLRLTVTPGEQTLGVTVWDELGGTVGVLRLDLDVGRKRDRAYLRTKS